METPISHAQSEIRLLGLAIRPDRSFRARSMCIVLFGVAAIGATLWANDYLLAEVPKAAARPESKAEPAPTVSARLLLAKEMPRILADARGVPSGGSEDFESFCRTQAAL